jgi:hypothetical protein
MSIINKPSIFRLAGEVQCPAVPGSPIICVNPSQSCPSACAPGFKVCGLQRVDGLLVVGSDRRPLPNCVLADTKATLCDQPSIRPLPSKVQGGNGLGRWDSVRLNGTSADGSNVGSIAEIGSDAFSGGPTFFAGNGSDPSVSVNVRAALQNGLASCHHFATVYRHRCCRLHSAVRHTLFQLCAAMPFVIFCQIRPFCQPNFEWSTPFASSFSNSVLANQVLLR